VEALLVGGVPVGAVHAETTSEKKMEPTMRPVAKDAICLDFMLFIIIEGSENY
jgi:hypothetical protein